MNTNKKLFRYLITATLAFALALVSSIGLLNVSRPKYQTYASNGANQLEVSISNNNFKNSVSSTYPFAPSSYSTYSSGVEANLSNFDISAGVINLSLDEYLNKFSNVSRNSGDQKTLDDYVLMIDTKGNSTDFEYRTSSNISMAANSHYMITADIYTATNNGIANLTLYSEDGSQYSKISNINSYCNWTTCTFLISTGNIETNVKLGLSVSGNGIALFDNLSAYQINNKMLDIVKTNLVGKESISAITNQAITPLVNYTIEDGKFSDGSLTKSFSIKNFEFGKDSADYIETSTVDNSNGKNNTAFKISNKQKTFITYETEEDFLSFEQNLLYRVTVSAKTENLSGIATLQLIQTNVDSNEAISSDVITISSSTSNEQTVTNGYKDFTFFVSGHPSLATSFKLAFGLGDASNLTTGNLYISSVQVDKVDNSIKSATTGDFVKNIDLTKNLTYSKHAHMLDNGNFNAMQIDNIEHPFPATAKDWTISLGNNNQYYGIINTSSAMFNKIDASKFTNLVNPYSTETNQNVLMMYNASGDTLAYTSTAKTLTAGSYHKFDVLVQTQNSKVKLALVSKINNKEVELASTEFSSNSTFSNASLYIHTGYQDLDVSLKISLITENDYGYAYIDNTKFDYLTEPTADEFNNVTNSSLTAKADLTNLFETKENGQFTTPYYFSGTGNAIKAGIINLEGEDLITRVINDENVLPSFKSINTKQVLGIRTIDENYYSLTSNFGYSFSSGKYYKIEVRVFTRNLTQTGANIKLSGFDDSFTNIISNNEWTNYTFYISPSTDITSNLVLSLGDSENLVSGEAYFGKVEISENIEESVFNQASNSDFVKVLQQVKSDSTEDNNTDNNSNENQNNFNWLYFIPSMIFALSIIICVVAVFMKKVKWKKPTKKSKNNYDRNSLSKQLCMRKATALREAKIRELNQNIQTANQDRANYEAEYKKDLARLREMKIKRASAKDIAKVEKEIKKNQKLSASIGVTINKYNSELAYIKTDAYLNNLAKKISYEAQFKKDEETENQ